MKYRLHQVGASMVEVLITIVIVGFGLLGIAGMQLSSISKASSSYYRGVAVDLGVDLAERVRALRSPYLATSDATVQPGKPPNFEKCTQNIGADPTCSNQDAERSNYQNQVNLEMTDWNSMLRSQLPPGATYQITAYPIGTTNNLGYKLTLVWRDTSRGYSSDTGDGSYVVYIE
jgi:type IV pilus assembly protein PilV